jgi:RHS repeat-associated protein
MDWSWSHDAAHRLVGAQLGAGQSDTGLAGAWSYGYGQADELATITTIKADGNEDIYRFTAGGSGRITSLTDPEGGSADLSYDSDGRRIEDDRYYYTYTWRGHLAEVETKADGERVEYQYDATGRLLKRTHYNPDGDIEDILGFVWYGWSLVAEVVLNHQDEVLWTRQYTPGPTGLDDSPQVRVERTAAGGGYQVSAYSFVRDEMGTVIGIIEDRPTEEGDPPPLLARYLYTPYGEAHIERGPELLRIDYDASITVVGDIEQTEPVVDESAPGSIWVRTTLPLDESSIAAGISVIRYNDGTEEWENVNLDTFAIAQDTEEPSRLLIMPKPGWLAAQHLRITLSTDLKDELGRPLQLPEDSPLGYEIEVLVPVPVVSVLSFDAKTFDLEFDNVIAASDTLNGKFFPVGQTRLFQGLWTDPVTGLAYARNRWYDHSTAAWLSEDPIGSADSQNLYAFVGWAPHKGVDPLGKGLLDRYSCVHGFFIMRHDIEQFNKKMKPVVDAVNGVEGTCLNAAGGAAALPSIMGKGCVGAVILWFDLTSTIDQSAPSVALNTVFGVYDRNDARIEIITEHPEKLLPSWSETSDKVLYHEARGEYFQSGLAAGEYADEVVLLVYGGAELSIFTVRLGRSVGGRIGRILSFDDLDLAGMNVGDDVMSQLTPRFGEVYKYPKPNQTVKTAIIDLEEALLKADYSPTGSITATGAAQEASSAVTIAIAGEGVKVSAAYARLGMIRGGTISLNGRVYRVAPAVVRSSDLTAAIAGRSPAVCVEPKIFFDMTSRPIALGVFDRRTGRLMTPCLHCEVNVITNLNRFMYNN